MKNLKFCFSTIAAILFFSFSTQAQNLVAWYKFDGNANDASTNTNNGTVTGASLTTDRFGKANSAYSFNGSSNYISVPHHSSLNVSNITITAWVYAVSTPSVYSGIIHKRTNADRNAFSTAASTGSFRFSGRNTDGTSIEPGVASAVSTGAWQHLAYVYNGGAITLYVNGIQVLSNTTQSGKVLSSSAVAMEIGRTLWFPSGIATYTYWNGKIDDVKIYDAALSACQISAQANSGQDLVAFYPFDGNANDASVNTNNGTVTGATLTTDRFGKSNSAYSYNGSSDFISVPHHSSLNVDNLTITAWVYANSTPSVYSGIIHKRTNADRNAFSTAASTGSFRLSSKNSDGTSNEPGIASVFSTGSWQQIAYVYSGGTITLYVNGVPVLTDATYTGKTLSYSSAALEIGRTLWFPSFVATYTYWDGKIDDLKIYGRALTACEVAGLNGSAGTSFGRSSSDTENDAGQTSAVVNVFPNPLGKGHLTIDAADVVSVKVYDQTGVEVKSFFSGFDQIVLDVKPGQYMLVIEQQDGTITRRKIIKE